MDTQNSAVAEIPNFKLAKVGKGRERKRGGASWLSGARGAGSGFSGAVGGSGAGAAGLSLGKIAMVLALSLSAGSAAWKVGRARVGKPGAEKPAVKKVFGEREAAQYSDTSNVIKAENSIPNSMGYVSGSLDGMTPEERAKKQADEEAARAAQEAADKKAADEEAKKADAPAPAASGADPATIASMNAADRKKSALGDGKFGKLGSGLGGAGGSGGLSGGSGLSGGINRNFGGMSGMNAKPKVNAGSMSAFKAPSKPGYSSGGHALAGRSGAKGFAKRQLDNAFTQSRQAMSASKSENASAGAASAFDNNSGAGSVIEGPGVGAGAKMGTADGGANPMASNSGGPVGGSDTPCSASQYPDQNGVCQDFKKNNSKDGASYQWMIDAVKGLMVVTALLATLYMIAWQSTVWSFGTSVAIMDFCANALVAVGAIIAGLGAMIMSASGDYTMGGIITGLGLFVAANGYWPETLMGGDSGVMLAVGTLITTAGGYMAAANVKQPAAMQ